MARYGGLEFGSAPEPRTAAMRGTSADCLRSWMVDNGVRHVLVSAVLNDEEFRSDLAASEGLTTFSRTEGRCWWSSPISRSRAQQYKRSPNGE